MSIGDGMPKFSVWLTISAGRNANCTPGNSSVSVRRNRRTYSAVGL
jgi:hypothetical protein